MKAKHLTDEEVLQILETECKEKPSKLVRWIWKQAGRVSAKVQKIPIFTKFLVKLAFKFERLALIILEVIGELAQKYNAHAQALGLMQQQYDWFAGSSSERR